MAKDNLIDFSKIKFGTMTRMAKEHGQTPKQFAKSVLQHPEDYSKKAVRKARFYKNILVGHK